MHQLQRQTTALKNKHVEEEWLENSYEPLLVKKTQLQNYVHLIIINTSYVLDSFH